MLPTLKHLTRYVEKQMSQQISRAPRLQGKTRRGTEGIWKAVLSWVPREVGNMPKSPWVTSELSLRVLKRGWCVSHERPMQKWAGQALGCARALDTWVTLMDGCHPDTSMKAA